MMMVTNLTYALVLFAGSGTAAETHAVFATAAECRAERRALLEDLEGTRMAAACVPQNNAALKEAVTQLKVLFDTMSDMDHKQKQH